MNGILSRAPGQPAIRLLLGTHLLLNMQSAIVLLAGTQADAMLRVLCGAILVMSLSALAAAIHGGPADDGTSWYLRRRSKLLPGRQP
jgi:hypothetical protein